MLTDADAKEYAETLLRHFADKLSEWEDGFVRSILRQMEDGRALSEKQRVTLDDIMERRAGAYGR